MFQEPLGMGSISMDCLPDDLLVQILSLLPTKQAVRTSILSKRWKTLFASTHNLDFDEPVFLFCGKKQKSFNDFADSSLSLQGGKHIKKFSIKLRSGDEDEHNAKRWICNALEHGITELHLRIRPILWRYLPAKFFTSTTLVNLSLGTGIHITSLPSDTSLPTLKILFLDSIWFDGDQLADLFLAACPALEDLTIHYRKFYPKYSFVISGKTIKKLSVTYYNCKYPFNNSRIISLETPSVVDLYYSDYPRCEFPRCQLDSLAKATLDLRFLEDNKRQQQNDADVTNLISWIRNVKTLRLTSSAVEVISVCCKGGLPVFNNLINLVFSSNKRRGWRMFLPLLLERSPNLETLVLPDLHYYTSVARPWIVGIQIPLNNQIKMLRIMDYHGSENELKHISHFLLNMKCLEVVKVYVAPRMGDRKKRRLTKDMLKLPTASSNLKIQVI